MIRLSFAKSWTSFFNKTLPNLILRIALMFFGLSFLAFGIALSRATDLGTSPISCVPAVLSYAFEPITLGTFTFWFNAFLLVLQVVLLRRNFKPGQLLSIFFVFVFSATIDFFVPLTQSFPMPNYLTRIVWSLVSCFFIAFGVWVQVKAKLILVPGDGFVFVVSTVLKKEYSATKIANDVSLIILASLMSLILMGGLFGVREGTVIAAVLVGMIIKLLDIICPKIGNFEHFCPTEGKLTLTPDQ